MHDIRFRVEIIIIIELASLYTQPASTLTLATVAYSK
jgi:hypothetical protein